MQHIPGPGSSPPPRRIRRVAAAVAVGLVMAACSAANDAPAAIEVAAGDPPATAPPETSPPPLDPGARAADALPPAMADPPPVPPPFELSEHEVLPDAKQLAADVAQALTTYEPGTSPADLADALGLDAADDDLLGIVADVHHERAWSRGRVVYPQLGGATDLHASVMVVVDQQIGFADGRVGDERRTVDVRLAVRDGSWHVEWIASAGGTPVPRPRDLGPEARAVLDDARITLPDSAVWDIHAGRIEPPLLAFMAALAQQAPYEVTVLDTGHPWEVFGTARQSAHTRGQAVDIYAVDGRDVVEHRQERSTLYGLVRWLYAQPEVHRIGSPWALDGFGGRSFTDIVHEDHLHVHVLGRT